MVAKVVDGDGGADVDVETMVAKVVDGDGAIAFTLAATLLTVST